MADNEVIIDYMDDEENDTKKEKVLVEGEEIYYKAGEIAEQIGISRDMVRYYTNQFSEFLNVTKTKEGKGGHSRYKGEDLETLQMIVALQNQHKTVAEIKTLLKAPGVNILVNKSADNEKPIAALLAQNNQFLLDAFENILKAQETKYIEDKEQVGKAYKEDIDKLSSEVNDLKEICDLQTELLHQLLSKEYEKNNKKGLFGFFKR